MAFEEAYSKSFDFRTGFLTDIAAGGFSLPCVWLCPLELVAKTGRTEGVNTYAGVFYMLESSEDLTPEAKDGTWDEMEAAATGALSKVVDASDLVVDIDKIKGIPNEGAYTGYNDISLKVVFEVMMSYCEY